MPLVENDQKLSASAVCASEELERLGPEWQELFRRIECDNVFLSYEWMSQWWKHLGKGAELFVIVVRDGRSLIGIAPFYISFRGGPFHLRRLGFLGDRWVGSCYLDFIVDPSCALNAAGCIAKFIQEHQSHWDYIELSGRSGESIAATGFQVSMRTHRVAATRGRALSSLYATLPETPESYFASRGKQMRRNLNRYLRALKREGPVDFLTLQCAPEIHSAFDDLLRLHAARFGARAEVSAFLDRRVASFHRDVLTTLAASGFARLYLLKLHGHAIAALYGFTAGNKMFLYQSGIDPAYSHFSVGVLLFSAVIEDAIRTHHAEVDFLSGDQSYKHQWATNSRLTETLCFAREDGKGKVVQTMKTLVTSIRSWKYLLTSHYTVRRVLAGVRTN